VKQGRPENLAHSIQVQLKNLATNEKRVYQELLLRHALERFLHRLSRTPHRERFILKGALLLEVWTGLRSRPTRDIDLLGPLGLEPADLLAFVADCALVDVEPDGWVFDHETAVVRPIRETALYSGSRVTFDAHLGKSRVRLQLDVGSGDEVVPSPSRLVLPVLLDQSAPDPLCYSPYTSIAEKLDAMILLGISNSRMKDYFDIVYLSKCMEFSGAAVRKAIAACCDRRRTALSSERPEGLAVEFGQDQQARTRWDGFIKKSGLDNHAAAWPETVAACSRFLLAPLLAAAENREFESHWLPGGPWVEK